MFINENIIARYGWWVGNDSVQKGEEKSMWEKDRISSSLYSTSSKLSPFLSASFSIKKKNLNFYEEKDEEFLKNPHVKLEHTLMEELEHKLWTLFLQFNIFIKIC